MRRPRSVIRRLVLVTTVVGLLTGLLGLAVVRYQERQAALATAGDAALASAERTASLVDGRIDGLLAQLRLFATRQELTGGDTAAVELEVALPVTEEIHELVLYDRSGQPVAAAAADRVLRPEDVDGRDPISDADDAGAEVALVDSDTAMLELAVPVESPPGTVVGVLVGRALPELVADEVTQRPSSGGRSALVTSAGRTFADRDRDRVVGAYAQPLSELPEERPVGRVDTPEGRAVVAAAPLRSLDAAVVVEQLEADILAPGRSTLAGPTEVLLVVVIAIVLAVIVTGRRLLAPLRQLAGGVSRLAAGDRGVRVHARGSGEVAELAAGFNRMATALELRQRELESAERSARMNEERLRLVVEGVEGYAIVLLDVLGDVRTWNAGARRVTGWDEEDVVGRRLTDLTAPEEPIDDPVIDATRTGRGEAEGWFVRPDRTRFWGELTVTALQRDDGAPSGYAAILQDVTERRAARHALELALHREQQAASELRRTNELKDEFLAVAAHEIRTPLSAILGATQVLAPGPDGLDAAETEEVRRIIWRHANDMHRIVERLLAFTQLQAGHIHLAPRRVDLPTEVARLVASLADQLADHELVLDIEDVEPELDPGFLDHVVSNLLSNAAKFSPEGSRVTVTMHVTEDVLTCVVADEGPGIAPEEHDRIFELFRQSTLTGASARGTGVGLTIVGRYLELVGGSVEVDSDIGRGARFTVRVPATRGEVGLRPDADGRGTPVR